MSGRPYDLGCSQVELEVIPVTKYQFIYMRFVVSCYSLGAILHFGVMHKRTELVEFANQLIEAVIKFERSSVGESGKSMMITPCLAVLADLMKLKKPSSPGPINRRRWLVHTCRWLYLVVDFYSE
ncbi:unnamed protein product, partial [Allacma fusca]